MVRDVQFVHPVKARIGPPQAVCHQTQRLSVFVGRHLVLETSQVMSGIPYSDSFRCGAAGRCGCGGGVGGGGKGAPAEPVSRALEGGPHPPTTGLLS
jgi:hypothetical protein